MRTQLLFLALLSSPSFALTSTLALPDKSLSSPAAGDVSKHSTSQPVKVSRLILKLKPDSTSVVKLDTLNAAKGLADLTQIQKFSPQARALRIQTMSLKVGGLSKILGQKFNFERLLEGDAVTLSLDKPVTEHEAQALALNLAKQPEVEYATWERRFYANRVPNDPQYALKQWHYFSPGTSFNANNKTLSIYGGINLPDAWSYSIGNANIVVAVLDSGIRPHPDLMTNLVDGYDFISADALSSSDSLPANFVSNDGDGRDPDPTDPGDGISDAEAIAYPACSGYSGSGMDSSWHGTHIAGTIAARGDNNLFGVGVAWAGKIQPVRVLGRCGGSNIDIADALRWAAGLSVSGVPTNLTPAKVINLSLGATGTCDPYTQSAINEVVAHGVTVIVAAGNDASSAVSAPANCKGVIAVTAHAYNGDNASYANYGSEVSISAPGGGRPTTLLPRSVASTDDAYYIWSSYNSGVQTPSLDSFDGLAGTSMATAHVSGVAALLLALDPSLSPNAIKSLIQTSARAHPAGGFCSRQSKQGCGAGLLDADAALARLSLNFQGLPVPITGPDQVAAAYQTVTLDGTKSTAPTGATLISYRWTQIEGPSVTLSSSNQALTSFVAPATGNIAFKLTVTDSLSNTAFITTAVRVNNPPVITSDITSINATVGVPIAFNLTANDVDNDTVTFLALNKPAGSTLSPRGEFTWTPSKVGAGVLLRVVAADDISQSTEKNILINVSGEPSKGSGGGGALGSLTLIFLFVLGIFSAIKKSLF